MVVVLIAVKYYMMDIMYQLILTILFRPFGFIAPKTLNYLAIQSFDCEGNWWRLLQKRVVRTIFDIYVFCLSCNELSTCLYISNTVNPEDTTIRADEVAIP